MKISEARRELLLRGGRWVKDTFRWVILCRFCVPPEGHDCTWTKNALRIGKQTRGVACCTSCAEIINPKLLDGEQIEPQR